MQYLKNLWRKFRSRFFRRKSYTQAILDMNPVAFYKLDETDGTTVHDSSGHAPHGELRCEEQL